MNFLFQKIEKERSVALQPRQFQTNCLFDQKGGEGQGVRMGKKKEMREGTRQIENFASRNKYKFQFQMRGRHSIEIKTFLEESRTMKKKDDPDSDSNLTTYSNNNSHTLKHSESSSTLHATLSQLSLIEQRHNTLEQDYQFLLSQTRQKADLLHRQKKELQMYRQFHQNDQREIERLTELISIVKKSSGMNQSKNTLSSSLLSKREKNSSSVPKERNHILTANSPILASREYLGVKEGKGLKKGGVRTEGKGQFGRYKFIPSVCLQ